MDWMFNQQQAEEAPQTYLSETSGQVSHGGAQY
jgi:hypothetical protein